MKFIQVPRPDDVDEQTWEDFCALRRAKKAPLTKTAWSRLCLQAKAAQMSILDVLGLCCEMGWQGFKAEWAQKPAQRVEPVVKTPHVKRYEPKIEKPGLSHQEAREFMDKIREMQANQRDQSYDYH